MNDNLLLHVYLEKIFTSSSETIFNYFMNGTVFKLTGADDIQVDFKVDGLFWLKFNERGSINGRFIKITSDEIILEWNVKGFQRPDETETLVEVKLSDKNGSCLIVLNHRNIRFKDAAAAKLRAWKEIFDELESQISEQT